MTGGFPVNDNPSITQIAFTRSDFVRCAQALASIIRITDGDDRNEAKVIRFEATETLQKIVRMIQTVDAATAAMADDELDNESIAHLN